MASILIVDDRASNREYLATLLGYEGHQLLQAADGAEALALAKAERPDLVITDIVMPQMDGCEFVRRLREHPTSLPVPVMFYTSAHSEAEARLLSEQCGVCRVLAKPADPSLILHNVAEALKSSVEKTPTPTGADFQQRHLRIVTDKLAEKVEQLKVSNSQLTALLDFGPQLIQERDRDRLLQKFCRTALAIVQARHIAVAIQESDKPCVYLDASEGDSEQPMRYLPLPPDKLPLEQFLKERGSVRMRDLADEAGQLGLAVPCPRMRPVLAVVLASCARPLGTLYFIEKFGRDEFSEEDERIGTMLAALLAMSLENDEHFQRVKELAAHQEGIREEERARIALEIHDELGQSLTGLKLDLAWLKSGLAKLGRADSGSALAERISEMSGAIDATIRSMRRIATELRPAVLDELGLVAAIEWQAQDFQKRTGMRCTVKGLAASVVLDQKRSIAVYRIFQEALTNVVRHADASQVTVELRLVEDHLVLDVSDNGKGITQQPNRQGRSLGLLGMNERVTSLGGFQQMVTSEGCGTRIVSWIPLREHGRRPPLPGPSRR